MTPDERLIQAAKTVAQLKHLYEVANGVLTDNWTEKNKAVDDIEKRYDTLGEVARKGKGAAYNHLRDARKEYNDALDAVHLAAVGVQP